MKRARTLSPSPECRGMVRLQVVSGEWVRLLSGRVQKSLGFQWINMDKYEKTMVKYG